VSAGLNVDAAKIALEAIAAGNIPNVKIEF
jgi:hypothetical protein